MDTITEFARDALAVVGLVVVIIGTGIFAFDRSVMRDRCKRETERALVRLANPYQP